MMSNLLIYSDSIHEIIVSKVEEVCLPKAIQGFTSLCSVTNCSSSILFCLKGEAMQNFSELTFAMRLKIQFFFFVTR